MNVLTEYPRTKVSVLTEFQASEASLEHVRTAFDHAASAWRSLAA